MELGSVEATGLTELVAVPEGTRRAGPVARDALYREEPVDLLAAGDALDRRVDIPAHLAQVGEPHDSRSMSTASMSITSVPVGTSS